MRGCLGVLLLAAAFVVVGGWFGGPPLAGAVVEQAFAGAGFESRSRSVVVLTEPPIEALAGWADRVVIGASDVVFEDVRADRLDVTLVDVDLLRATFGRIDGRLERVVLVAADGSTTEAETVELLGPPGDVLVTLRVSGATVAGLARAAVLSQTGLAVDAVKLEAPSTIAFFVGPTRIDGLLAVDAEGALTMALGAPGSPVIRVLAPGGPFGLSSVTIADGDLVLIGRVDVRRYLPEAPILPGA